MTHWALGVNKMLRLRPKQLQKTDSRHKPLNARTLKTDDRHTTLVVP